jgi:hypothetical protein
MKTLLLIFALTCVTVAAQTNTPPAAPDKVGAALEWLSAALNGVLSLVSALLLWWGSNKSKIADVVKPIIKAVESHGSPALKKQIKDEAGSAGVEPTLHALVKANTNGKPADVKAAIVSILLIGALLIGVGCARFSTTQTDSRDGEKTTITTKAASWTLFSSKSSLAKWKATQTEKSQGAEVGGLEQQGGTNAVAVLQAIGTLLQALPK